MKRIISCILMLAMLLPFGSAFADQSLYDMWIDYTYDYPDYIRRKVPRSEEFGRRIDGCWVDITSDYLLREEENIPTGGTAKDLIRAWSNVQGDVATPFLRKLAAANTYKVGANLKRSESYSCYNDVDRESILELYWLDISYNSGYRGEKYSVIVCVQDDHGDMSVEYVVTRGDTGVLGFSIPEKATSNYLGDMFVNYCDEWVSLRETPSTKATRLTKVPLYDVVTDCYAVGETGFVFCKYEGQEGFILWEYLSPIEYLDSYR